MDYYSGYITKLIEELSALPGVGPKTAGRLAFHILDMPSEQVHDLASAIVKSVVPLQIRKYVQSVAVIKETTRQLWWLKQQRIWQPMKK